LKDFKYFIFAKNYTFATASTVVSLWSK